MNVHIAAAFYAVMLYYVNTNRHVKSTSAAVVVWLIYLTLLKLQ